MRASEPDSPSPSVAKPGGVQPVREQATRTGGKTGPKGVPSAQKAPLPPRPPRWIPYLPEVTLLSFASVVGLIGFLIVAPFPIFLVLWAFVAPILTYIFVSAILGLKGLVREPLPGIVARSRAQLIFVFAAKFCPPFVREGVESVHRACGAVGYTNFAVYVVSEVDAEIPGARVVVVPESYKCAAKYKARALNYALQYLPNTKDAWILHLDEDAQVVPQSIGAILSFIEEKGQSYFVANGFNAGTYNGRLISFVAEAFRPVSFAWHHTFMRHGRALWMYGSNMLIRSDVEQYVTWETGLYNAEMAGEDAMFGYKAYRAFGPVFAWHGGLSVERAPSTLRGTLKQRRRWFFSGLSLIMSCPARLRPIRIYAALGWACGMFIVGFGFVREIGFIEHHNWIGVPLWFLPLGIFLVLLWLIRIEINMVLTLRHNGSHPSPLRRLLWCIVAVPLAPVAGLFIVGGPLIALLFPPKGFQITDK